jgi:glycosyltransferase involved in cell wall biosynthesis
MRVLQVINTLLPGGAEMLLQSLAPRFQKRHIECSIYMLRSYDTTIERALRSKGLKVYAPLDVSVYSPRHIAPLAAHLRTHEYDLVHVHLFPSQLWTVLAAQRIRKNLPLVTTEHNTYSRRRRKIYRPVDRWMYSHYRSIACISRATEEKLHQWIPDLRSEIRQCPNGIDVDEFAKLPRQSKSRLFSLPEEAQVILSVGRLELQKDHKTTIRALTLLDDVHLVIVGVGPMLGELQDLGRQLGVANRVHFLGRRDDVPVLLKAADAFVQSSLFEGFGIAALEAMASGLPVVATWVPGLAQVMGDAGLLFEVGDHQQLANQLRLLLHNDDLRTDIAEACKDRAKAFSIEKTADCYQQLYRESVEAAAPVSKGEDFIAR